MNKNYLLALLPSLFYINSVSAENLVNVVKSVTVEMHTNGYDKNGKPIKIDTSSFIKDNVSGKIYSKDGGVYIDKGTYEIWDNEGNIIVKDCSESFLFTDPNVVPDVTQGDLPGPECYFQQIEYHEDGSEYENMKKKRAIDSKNEIVNSEKIVSYFKTSKCSSFYGYAPPLAYSVPIRAASHVGSTTYKVTLAPKGDTEIFSWIKFYGTNKRWIDYKFRKSARFVTGDVAASVWISFNGIPFGSVVTGNAC